MKELDKLIKKWKITQKKRKLDPLSEEWCITQIINDLEELKHITK